MRNRLYPAAENITLEALLRRRRTNLARYMEATGVHTYEALLERCASIGVTPPTRRAFDAAHPHFVSSPAEGVVVVPPMGPTISERTGEPVEAPKKKRRPEPVVAAPQPEPEPGVPSQADDDASDS